MSNQLFLKDNNMEAVPVTQLVSTTLTMIKVNRADSGSPQWKKLYFLCKEDAICYLANELPENCLGDPVTVVVFLNPITNEYFIQAT